MVTTKDLQEYLNKFEEAVKEHNKLYYDVVNRWERLGLLEGLETGVKEECAVCFERMAMYLIYEKNPENCDWIFETVVFPIIRRVLDGSPALYPKGIGSFNGKFNPKEIEEFYYDNLDKVKEEVIELAKEKGKGLEDLDFEAEWTALMSNKLIEKYKEE
ncbi:MAG: hypothetical protein J6X18_05645 [Bacteroidales bacterium]|nr:hypothetical protein [Bacteroidales bacterium]